MSFRNKLQNNLFLFESLHQQLILMFFFYNLKLKILFNLKTYKTISKFNQNKKNQSVSTVKIK